MTGFAKQPHSWLGKTAPSGNEAVPSFYKERPSSVTVLGKKISPDAVVNVNPDTQFHPIPISFESAKPKQHFQRSRQLQDISNKPKPPRAQSAVNAKLLSKIKIYSQHEPVPRENKKPKDTKPAKKPRPPKAPRSGKSKDQKKAAVPRITTESVSKAPKRESPHINVVPKIEEIVQQSLKNAHEEKIREEEDRIKKQLEELKRRQLLKQKNLKIRYENRRFQGNSFKPRAAWGIDERKIYGNDRSRIEARFEKEDKMMKRQRAKSVGKDRVGTEALNEIKAELRSQIRSQSVMGKPTNHQSGRASVSREIRRPDPSVQDYIKYKKQEIKDLQERECISQLAMEAKRLSQLKNLDAKAKVAIKKFKKKRRKAQKKRTLPDIMISDSNTVINPEDDEVDDIMNRFLNSSHSPEKKEGRESRNFGVILSKQPLSEEKGNATQEFQADKKYEGSYKPSSLTAPIDFKAGFHSSHTDLHIPVDSHNSSMEHYGEPVEESSIFEDDEEPSLQLSEISKRKEEIRKRVAELRKRADEVHLKVREEVNETPLRSEGTQETPLNLPVMRVSDFESMMQEQAAIKIQSNIRRFLAISRFERHKADLMPQDLSFHSDEIEEPEEPKTKFADRLRIGIRGEWGDSNDSGPDLLASSDEDEEIYDAGKHSEEREVHLPTSEPYRRNRIEDDSDETDDLEQLLERSRPMNPGNEDYEDSEDQDMSDQGEIQQMLLQELQSMKDREQALEDVIEQQNSRQIAEEAKKDQIKKDLAKLRAYDRNMLEEVAARSGASMLTELLSRLFDQRYKRLEELFKGNSNAIQEAISGDMPYFEQLEQCLKEAENAKRSGRGEATSIDNLLDVLIEKSDKADKSENVSGDVSLDYIASREIPNKEFETKKRQEFEDEIKKLEQELNEQDASPVSDSVEGERHMLRRQPFSGILTGYSDQRSDETEQHISDLSAEINSSDDLASPGVINQPFSMVHVYISTEEDSPSSPIPHQESPDPTEVVINAFPSIRKAIAFNFDAVPEPDKPLVPVTVAETPSPVKEEKPKAPVVVEKPKTSFIEEKSKSPAKEEKPKTPFIEEKPKTPFIEEKPRSVPVIEEKPKSPIKEEKPQAPLNSLERPKPQVAHSPEKPMFPENAGSFDKSIGASGSLSLDDIMPELTDQSGSMIDEGDRTQVNIAGECLADEIFEFLIEEALEIFEQVEIAKEDESLETMQSFKFPFKPSESDEHDEPRDFKFPYNPRFDPSISSESEPDEGRPSRAHAYQVENDNIGESLMDSPIISPNPQAASPISTPEKFVPIASPSPKKADRDDVAKNNVANLLSEAILADLLCSELDKYSSSPSNTRSPPRGNPDMPSLSLENVRPQRDDYSSNSVDFALKTDTEAVIAYTEEIFTIALQTQKEQIDTSLSNPLKTDSSQVLEQLQNQELTSFTGRNSSEIQEIIPVSLYIDIENAKAASSKRSLLSPNTAQAVSEAGNIHNKMIFDCVNEALAMHRPYGLKGVPMPWSCNTRALAPSNVGISRVTESVKDSIRRWSSIQAGKIPSNDMVLSSGLLDEEYLQHVRAERLEACITLELIENDAEWVDYEYEETQAKLDLADIVLDHLVTETFDLLQSLS